MEVVKTNKVAHILHHKQSGEILVTNDRTQADFLYNGGNGDYILTLGDFIMNNNELRKLKIKTIKKMKRFMGMMPSSEIEKEQQFKVGVGQLTVRVQAGEKGWTIIYADQSSEYEDIIDTTENNFNKAMSVLETHFSDINSI